MTPELPALLYKYIIVFSAGDPGVEVSWSLLGRDAWQGGLPDHQSHLGLLQLMRQPHPLCLLV